MSEQFNCENEALIHQMVKVQAQITVTPLVKHAKPRVYCIDTELKPNDICEEYKSAYYQAKRECARTGGTCSFTVTQVLCIEIPIAFDVDVDMDQGISCCGKPVIEPCKPHCDDSDDRDE